MQDKRMEYVWIIERRKQYKTDGWMIKKIEPQKSGAKEKVLILSKSQQVYGKF